MTCLHPITVGHGSMRCGRCVACRITITREWTHRLLAEYGYWDKSAFITLTYSDEFVPENMCLVKKDLQLFLKRLRKELSRIADQRYDNGKLKPFPLKYFACGEYGETTSRPHYHLIMFGIDKRYEDVLLDCWHMGMIDIGSVTKDSIQYVCGYVMKKYNGDVQKQVFGDRPPQFMVCSKGLGGRWLQDNKKQLLDNCGITMSGKPIGIPKYYRYKLGDDLTEEWLEYNRRIASDKARDKAITTAGGILELAEVNHKAKLQAEEGLKTKQNSRRKKL